MESGAGPMVLRAPSSEDRDARTRLVIEFAAQAAHRGLGATLRRDSQVIAMSIVNERCVASGVEPGDYVLEMSGTEMVRVVRDIRLEADRETRLEIELTPSVRGRGQIMLEGGALTAGGVIEAKGRSDVRWLRAEVEPNGEFEFEGLDPREDYELRLFPYASGRCFIPSDPIVRTGAGPGLPWPSGHRF